MTYDIMRHLRLKNRVLCSRNFCFVPSFVFIWRHFSGLSSSSKQVKGKWLESRLAQLYTGPFCQGKSTYFITTPIFYVNAEPHIGHLYSACIADVRHRWEIIKGKESIFSTGTDEHGMKIQKAAEENGKSPKAFCDEVSSQFKSLFNEFDIGCTDFIRTTDPRHKEKVYEFWNKLYSGGFIYRGKYQGWYSVSDEAFLTELQVEDRITTNGDVVKVSKDSGHAVEWMQEENYMFRLSQFKDDLRHWLNGNVIRPSLFRPLVDRWLTDLHDLSVSREASRHKWGIPVPADDTQTIYVWLDALVNYLTVAGSQSNSIWPPDCHVVGKDILKFHAIYWPAFLMAADLPLPESILCHSHWTVDNVKMSKSLGNVVNPVDRLQRYGSDGLRYFLLKEGVAHNDGNYNDVKVVELLNADLCNTLGNLLRRCTAPKIHPDQTFPPMSEPDQETTNFLKELYQLSEMVDEEFTSMNFYRGLDQIIHKLHEVNGLLQHRQVWTLEPPELYDVLYLSMESLRVCSILLQPVVPRIAARVLDRLGVPNQQRTFDDSLRRPQFELPKKLGEDKGMLYPRIK